MKKQITFQKVCVHNLKNVDLKINFNQLVVFSGVSGSGKSSLAFDTIFVEGQRRYVESLSIFARRQMGDMRKPDYKLAEGITPTISIEQKSAGHNPRSTVGTMTQIYDYLRVLFARVGTAHCPISGETLSPQNKERIIHTIQAFPEKTKLVILSPYAHNKKAEFVEEFIDLRRKGFVRVRIDGEIVSLDQEIALDGSVSHTVDLVIDRIVVNQQNHSRLADAIVQALEQSQGSCIVINSETGEEQLFSTHAHSPKSGFSYKALEPQDFSFNSPSGMCTRCQGLGMIHDFDLDKVIDPSKSIMEDCCSVGPSSSTVYYGNVYRNLKEIYHVEIETPWKDLSEEHRELYLYGDKRKKTRMFFIHPETGARWIDYVAWRGILYEAHRRYIEAKSKSYRTRMEALMTKQACPECHGTRLKPYPAATRLEGKTIAEVTDMTVDRCLEYLKRLKLDKTELLIASELLKEILERLQFLLNVGLHYLTLSRIAPTLSGGEAQRVRLASQIGSGLVGITYILDEPSIGLHPRDNTKLLKTLKSLRDKGNNVIVVEHDEETLREADHIIDFGPGAGVSGGEILFSGSVDHLIKNKKSLTGDYLSGRKSISLPKKRRQPDDKFLSLREATLNNLKHVNVDIPLGLFIAVTGVSGSGKSSLILDTLHPALAHYLHRAEKNPPHYKELLGLEHIDKVIAIDQSPIGRNPRSNPATYIKLFDEIRDLFTQLPESRSRGYAAGRFSFNVKVGSCPKCSGIGMLKIDMDFLETAWVECTECRGHRFDHETLTVRYKEKNIYDVLEMDVNEALTFFANQPSIRHKLELLERVGMGYIKLGQPSTTLSGGEAQRIKLAKELVRPARGKTVYILDEPTTGLHFHDISHLLKVLHELVSHGHTVFVIEHNMDVVKTADWILDLGPDGGEGGGQLIASQPPEEVILQDTPTGRALKQAFSGEFAPCFEEEKAEYSEAKGIEVKGAQQHNLKHVSATIPRGKLTICTGPSGSGKSSFAFDTVYAEGQRRYTESLSSYARQFVKQMPKPIVEEVEGLSPAIAIEQVIHSGNPRSTIGTMTEIYDFLRVLFARLGTPHCPETGEEIQAISKDHVVEQILNYPRGTKLYILAPLEIRKGEAFETLITRLKRQGYLRIRLDGTFYHIEEDEIPYDSKRKHQLFLVIDRLVVTADMKHRLYEAVENASEIGHGKLTTTSDGKDRLFNLTFSVPSTGKSYPEITPHTFSFNTQEGMCPNCQGLGVQYGLDLIRHESLRERSPLELIDYINGWQMTPDEWNTIEKLFKKKKIPPHEPLKHLPAKKLDWLMQGKEIGINRLLDELFEEGGDQADGLRPLLEPFPCPDCEGDRVQPLARHVTINKLNIADLCRLPIDQAFSFIKKLKIPKKEAKFLDEVKNQLTHRMSFLLEVGLGYLALERRAPTLSGGEAQRIRLARQLGSGLTSVLYVLDEPTIGLHPSDSDRLMLALKRLQKLGNTLLMVEHDLKMISHADKILDFGPGAGQKGGMITASGTPKQIIRNKNSLTGEYLSGKKEVERRKKRRKNASEPILVTQANLHNLQNINVKIPTGILTTLAGVSGSGKSTLMQEILLPAFQRGIHNQDCIKLDHATVTGIDPFAQVISIDQSPIGRTIRADIATYTDILTPLRILFASLPEAKAKGLEGKHFSYNHRAGMCTACWGLGQRRIEMHFLPPVRVTCDQCQGKRLNARSLEVAFRGFNLGEYLEKTLDELVVIFENFPRIRRPLQTLISVGLGYLKLGQRIVTLSGGEAQRIKISRELSKRSKGKTLYLLDEPTTGLHCDDIDKLLKVLHKLVDKGHTMVIIEHNLDVIKNSDYIIELGPGPGDRGGKIVCEGSPEKIASNPKSQTGPYLSSLQG